jgi:glutathione synthase
LFGEGREVREGQVGWLLRMKAEDVDEGGVAAGFSVLDSVLLVD